MLYCWSPAYEGFPGDSVGKESTCNAGDAGSIPGSERSPGRGHAAHSSILAWRIPWTEESAGLLSMGSQRAGHDWRDWAPAYKKARMVTSSLQSAHNLNDILLGQEKWINLKKSPCLKVKKLRNLIMPSEWTKVWDKISQITAFV